MILDIVGKFQADHGLYAICLSFALDVSTENVFIFTKVTVVFPLNTEIVQINQSLESYKNFIRQHNKKCFCQIISINPIITLNLEINPFQFLMLNTWIPSLGNYTMAMVQDSFLS